MSADADRAFVERVAPVFAREHPDHADMLSVGPVAAEAAFLRAWLRVRDALAAVTPDDIAAAARFAASVATVLAAFANFSPSANPPSNSRSSC